jgi:competence protein ComGF
METYQKNIFRYVKSINSKGFTFVEMLIAFALFLAIVSLIPTGLQIMVKEGPLEKTQQRLEWEVFISLVKKEIRMSEEVSIDNNKIWLKKSGHTILYEKYGANIRRRVDFKGHEIVLQKVNAVSFESEFHGVRISVEDAFNQNYSTKIFTMISGESFYAAQ